MSTVASRVAPDALSLCSSAQCNTNLPPPSSGWRFGPPHCVIVPLISIKTLPTQAALLRLYTSSDIPPTEKRSCSPPCLCRRAPIGEAPSLLLSMTAAAAALLPLFRDRAPQTKRGAQAHAPSLVRKRRRGGPAAAQTRPPVSLCKSRLPGTWCTLLRCGRGGPDPLHIDGTQAPAACTRRVEARPPACISVRGPGPPSLQLTRARGGSPLPPPQEKAVVRWCTRAARSQRPGRTVPESCCARRRRGQRGR